MKMFILIEGPFGLPNWQNILNNLEKIWSRQNPQHGAVKFFSSLVCVLSQPVKNQENLDFFFIILSSLLTLYIYIYLMTGLVRSDQERDHEGAVPSQTPISSNGITPTRIKNAGTHLVL